MRNRIGFLAIAACCLCGADWPTDGGNPQRTNWQKDETILTKANVQNLKIVWKLKLDNAPRQMHSLFPPLIVGKIAVVAGVSDNLYAIDTDKGEILWKKHFEY